MSSISTSPQPASATQVTTSVSYYSTTARVDSSYIPPERSAAASLSSVQARATAAVANLSNGGGKSNNLAIGLGAGLGAAVLIAILVSFDDPYRRDHVGIIFISNQGASFNLNKGYFTNSYASLTGFCWSIILQKSREEEIQPKSVTNSKKSSNSTFFGNGTKQLRLN